MRREPANLAELEHRGRFIVVDLSEPANFRQFRTSKEATAFALRKPLACPYTLKQAARIFPEIYCYRKPQRDVNPNVNPKQKES